MGTGMGMGRGQGAGRTVAGAGMGGMGQRLIVTDAQGLVVADTQNEWLGKTLRADELKERHRHLAEKYPNWHLAGHSRRD